jgi:hypothetical protein
MGGAAAAQRGDVSAGFWNPAGLTGIRGIQVEDQYSLLSLNQQLNYFGLALERRQQLFFSGAFLIYSAGGDLEARQGPSLNPDSIFGDTEMTFLLSVAGKLDRQWSMGINLKGFFNQLGAVSGTGFGGDWGVQYRISNETTFGFAVQDVYSSIGYSNSSTATEVFPATLRTGIADQDVKTHVKGELDMEWSNDVGWKPRAGIEWRPMEVIALRGGFWYEINTGSNNFSAGIGLLLPGAESLGEFDYTLLGDRLVPGGVLHQFSLKGKFL